MHHGLFLHIQIVDQYIMISNAGLPILHLPTVRCELFRDSGVGDEPRFEAWDRRTFKVNEALRSVEAVWRNRVNFWGFLCHASFQTAVWGSKVVAVLGGQFKHCSIVDKVPPTCDTRFLVT